MKLTRIEKAQARREKRVRLLLDLLNDPRVVLLIQGIMRRNQAPLGPPPILQPGPWTHRYPATPNPGVKPWEPGDRPYIINKSDGHPHALHEQMPETD